MRAVHSPYLIATISVAAGLLLGVPALGWAQPEPEAPASGAIAGRVVLAPGDLAFPAVEIVIHSDVEYRTITDGDGRFRADGLPPGRYRVEVTPEGFSTVIAQVDVGAEEAWIELRVDEGEVIELRGLTEAGRLRESAQAVAVVDTEDAQHGSADLGEVMSRSSGVSVRRSGGLGSSARFSLAGLTDDQIRFFLDGVPLELAGFGFGISNVPVNLVERAEVYRGVVPVRFGADALGGAVNLVTDASWYGRHAAASYQVGALGTHRLTLQARDLHAASGFGARINAFVDRAQNDYRVDVEVPDDRGRLEPVAVDRFHDAYRSEGIGAELGFIDRPWARRLVLRGFVTSYDKELQHNAVMTVPYGEPTYGETTTGATLRYAHRLGPDFSRALSIDAIAGYTHGRATFLDVSECVYDWFGRCIRERRQPGEIESRPHDQVFWKHGGFGRVNLEWQPRGRHALRGVVSPTYIERTGDERRQADPDTRDPLTADRKLLTFVSGVEYQFDVLDQQLQNILFAKDYVQVTRSEEPLPGGIFRRRDRETHRFGAGNGVRYRFLDWLYAKASYEWATRLPRPDEVFGDTVLILSNLELAPETSHNANLGFAIEAPDTAAGGLRLDVNGFLREADQLIVLLGNDRFFSYQNVFGARSLGAEAAAGWTSPGQRIVLDGNVTYQDFRNTSSQGTFGNFDGDRIPNRPYLFANGAARLRLGGLATTNDEAALAWSTRYVHEFFRGWESVGLREFKQVVPSQLLHSLALTYSVGGNPLALSFSAEVQNLTNEPAFDFFGIQRPGRAFYFKTTAEL